MDETTKKHLNMLYRPCSLPILQRRYPLLNFNRTIHIQVIIPVGSCTYLLIESAKRITTAITYVPATPCTATRITTAATATSISSLVARHKCGACYYRP